MNTIKWPQGLNIDCFNLGNEALLTWLCFIFGKNNTFSLLILHFCQ